MKSIKAFNIPTPCHELWNRMAPVGNGRYCENCCKTVVDFSKMPTRQVIEYLSSAKASCGYFQQNQMNDINAALRDASHRPGAFFKRSLLIASFIGLFSSLEASAQLKKRANQKSKFRYEFLRAKDTVALPLIDQKTYGQPIEPLEIKEAASQFNTIQGVVGGIVIIGHKMNFFQRLYYHLVKTPIKKIFG